VAREHATSPRQLGRTLRNRQSPVIAGTCTALALGRNTTDTYPKPAYPTSMADQLLEQARDAFEGQIVRGSNATALLYTLANTNRTSRARGLQRC
jgi:hypothetical protein